MNKATQEIAEDEVVIDDNGIDHKLNMPLHEGELVSDEFNDIISHKPNWIIRHGVSLIAAIVAILILFSWFVRYPDILKTSMNIVALNAPRKVLSKSEGKLQSLLVKNGEFVREQQPLAYLQSTGNHSDVFAVRKWIGDIEKSVKPGNIKSLNSIELYQYGSLGEMQQPFEEFQAIFRETRQTLSNGFYRQKLNALKEDLKLIEEQNEILLKQKKLIQEDYEIQAKEFKAREHLAEEKVIAPLELGQDKSKFISKSSALQQMETQLLNQKINYHNKQKEVIEMEKQIEDLQNEFFSSLSIFRNKIEEWVNRYAVLAPVTGKLQFVTALQENQHINHGQELFYVEPKNGSFYGEVVTSQPGFGKVAVGQSVIVRLESYPSSEFGYLSGKVTYVSSLLIRDSSFLIHVELPQGMQTSYGKVIPFKSNMKAKAEIITQNRRLLEKMFSNIIEKAKQ